MGIDVLPMAFNSASECEIDLVFVSLISRQLFSRLEKPEGPVASYFTGSITRPTMEATGERSWREFSGWARRQRGRAGRFRMFDPARPGPLYDVSVTPTTQRWAGGSYWSNGSGWVTGFLPPMVSAKERARYGANSIVIGYGSGFASINGIANPGDRFEIYPNGIPAEFPHYYEIVNQANSNTQGQTRIYFEPGLRASVAAGDGVVLRYPRMLARFASEGEARIRVTPPLLGTTKFAVIEAAET